MILAVERIEAARFTECEENILELFRRLRRQMTAAQIENELHKAGIVWARSTIHVALASLVARGLLTNRHNRRGYSLASIANNREQSSPDT